MFYKPLAAMRRWNLLRTHKSVLFDSTGKKFFKTEYELTPEAFYSQIRTYLADSAKREIDSV